MKRVCVIGSLNMDLVATVDVFPKPGETVTGSNFGVYPGGKGGNQAVAAARLGASVLMVGKLGDDMYGQVYLKTLSDNCVSCQCVDIEKGVSSGIAVIEVDRASENKIVVIPGANSTLDKEFIDSKWNIIEDNDIFLLQLEIPMDTVIHTIKKLKQHGKTVILDPAPVSDCALPDEIYQYIDFLTPNEIELKTLTDQKEGQLECIAGCLLDKGVKTIIAKAGDNGAFIVKRDTFIHVPAFRVKAIDTTAAGDTFNAGFAFALAQGWELERCVRFANAAGAIATTAMGAQEAMPTIEEIERFMKD